MDNEKKTSIIIVDYQSADRTISYIKHLITKVVGNYNIVIVDNSMDDENSNKIISTFVMNTIFSKMNEKTYKGMYCTKDIYLVISVTNGGYSSGNNLGALLITRLNLLVDYYIFSNNDIEILDSELDLNLFLKEFDNSNVGIIGPSIIGFDENEQSPYKYVSLFKRWIMYPLVYPFNKFLKCLQFNNDLISIKVKKEVYRVMGSFFSIKKSSFNKIGGFDEKTFLYGEEVILAEKIKKINEKTIYDPSFHLLHKHDLTISKYYNYQQKCRLQYDSEIYYYKKYIGVNRFEIFLSKICMELLIWKICLIHKKMR